VLSGLIPLLPSCNDASDDSREAVTQSTAVADLCATCMQALIGCHGDDDVSKRVISTMIHAMVTASALIILQLLLSFCLLAS